MHWFLALAAFAMASPAALASDVYHCNVDGRTVLQGMPCQGGDTISHIPSSSPQNRSPQPPPEPHPNSAWSVQESASPIDDSRTVVLRVSATELVKDKFGREYRPVLLLRCAGSTTSVFVNFDGLHMTDFRQYGSVTLRVDSQPAFTIRTSNSTDHQALGLWRGDGPIRTVRRMMGGDVLTVRATPYSESPITTRFPISGLDYEITPLRRACRW